MQDDIRTARRRFRQRFAVLAGVLVLLCLSAGLTVATADDYRVTMLVAILTTVSGYVARSIYHEWVKDD